MSDDIREAKSEEWLKGFDAGWNEALKEVMKTFTELHSKRNNYGNMYQDMPLYVCDPEKNTDCPKGKSCQTQCFCTSDPRFEAKDCKLDVTDFFRPAEEEDEE